MTLNDFERRNSPYFVFFLPNSIALLGNYVTVVADKRIMSVNIEAYPSSRLPLLGITNPFCSAVSLR